MNNLIVINHNIFGDIMIYFFINMFMYIVLIVLLYQFFNRQKLSILDFLLLLFNANVYFVLLFHNFSFIYGILVALMTFLIKNAYFSFYNIFTKNNSEILLIKEGIIDFKSLVKCGYSYDNLIKYLNKRRIRLDEVEYCFFVNGRLSIIRNKFITHYPVSVIIDGNIVMNNLEVINKDNKWLEMELDDVNLTLDLVDYAYFKKDKLYFVVK